MAEAAVTFLLQKSDNWLSKELSLSDDVRVGIKRLNSELSMATAILKDLDAQREQSNQIQQWIRLLQGVTYEIEDVLDMRAYQISHQNTHWRIGVWSSIGNHSIGSLIKEIEANITTIKDMRTSNEKTVSPHPASTSRAHHESGIAPLYTPEGEIVGVEEQREELASWVLDIERAYKVMFVVGMGGSGKTALVKLVYDQLKTDFDCHVWLTASKSVSSEELLSIMLSKLCNKTAQHSVNPSQALQDLASTLNNYLQDKRYLIIFDDLWTTEVWDGVKYVLPRNNCSRVIITTRRGNIASSCRESWVDVHRIQALPLKKARELFRRRSIPQSGVFPSATGQSLWVENLLGKCEGLPLGIIEIGKVLSREKSESELKKLHDSLQVEIASGQLSSIGRLLLLSYDDLPYNLKCCFLYMSMFGEYYLVKRRTLIRLWIAEGFIRTTIGKQVEDIAEEYLQELIERNLMQAGELDFDGRPQTCRVHTLMHKIALSKSETEKFCTIWTNHRCEISDQTRRLSIQNTEFTMANKDMWRLRTLFACLKTKTAIRISSGFKLLKILHLDGASVDSFPSGIDELLLLKYLCLSNTRIKLIPSSIGRLQHLETLNLKHTFVTAVPNTLTKLAELRHLLICRYNFNGYLSFDAVIGFDVSTEISKLTNLQKLSFVRGDHKLIQELKKMKELRKLGIIDLPSNSGPILCEAIQILKDLYSLNMTSLHREEVLHIQGIDNPPPLLQRLYLKGRLEKMPQWISKLHDLVRIRLKWSRLRQDNNPITILGELPSLLELQLLDAYKGDRLDFHVGRFPKLKILDFDQMEELTVIRIEHRALPCLQKLIISRCQNLRRIPLGIENVAQLKELRLGDMPRQFVEPIRRNGRMRREVDHIQKIHSTHLQNGTHCALDDLS
ncbi:hypothetical protein ABFX02_06G174300 [Erythranthe guttata]